MTPFFSHILDFIFPPSPETRELRTISPHGITEKLPRATASPYPFIISLFTYKHPLASELIHGIKNKKDPHFFKLAGAALYQELSRTSGQVILIPIPLSRKRRRERGYNQCELLITEIIKLDTEKRYLMDFNLLKRRKHTGEQKLKSRRERFANAESIFLMEDSHYDHDIAVIIIDDVTTTGSTLKEAHDVFMKAGYVNVRALTIAH
jgi:ComF family protein